MTRVRLAEHHRRVQRLLPRQEAAPRHQRRLAPRSRRRPAGRRELGRHRRQENDTRHPDRRLRHPRPHGQRHQHHPPRRPAARLGRRDLRLRRRRGHRQVPGHPLLLRRPGLPRATTRSTAPGHGVLTYLLTGAGHHVLKAGFDANWRPYNAITRTRAARPTGPTPAVSERPRYQVYDFRRYGAQTDVDVVNQDTIVNRKVKSHHRRLLRPGQLEHHGQGHPEPRPPLRQPAAARTTDGHAPAGAQRPVEPPHRRSCGIPRSRAGRRSSPTTAATTSTSRSTWRTALSAPRSRSARQPQLQPERGPAGV